MTQWADDVILWDDETPMVACVFCGEIPTRRKDAIIVTVTDDPSRWNAEWTCHKDCLSKVVHGPLRATIRGR